MDTYLIILVVVYYLLGVWILLKSWADDFDEISLSVFISTTLLFWLAWPIIMLVRSFDSPKPTIIWRRKH